MDDDGELVGLSLIRDKATRAGNFPHAVLGYEKQAVDSYVRELEKDRDDLRRDLRDLDHQLAAARASARTSDFTQVTGHAAVLVQAAEARSAEVTTQAELDARQLRDHGSRAAEELRSDGRQEADDLRATTLANLRRLREQQLAEIAALQAAARAEADAAMAAARRHAETLGLQADHAASALRSAAQQEALAIVTAAERYAAETRAEALREREQVLATAQAALRDVQQQCEALPRVGASLRRHPA